ncbi:MAG TPA: DUF927 domain-containing protein [Rhodospirillales bacterium]|nr:DUF927 domain-containing protein [Rhodospirillales bacterium]
MPPTPRLLYRLPGLLAAPAKTVLVVEGEKAADAAARIFPDLAVTTCPGGAKAPAKADWRPLRGRRVVVWPDQDEEGRAFARDVGRLVAKVGASEVAIVDLPETLPAKWDLADDPPPTFDRRRLRELVEKARPFAGEGTTDGSGSSPYRMNGHGISWLKPTRDGSPVTIPLTNFGARIVAEIERDDGADRSLHFEIETELAGRRKRFEVASSEFAGMGWVTRELGAKALLHPGHTVRDHARFAIQSLSPEPARRVLFAQLGWREIEGRPYYLHAGGAIGADGEALGIDTDLSAVGLARFLLPEPPRDEKSLREALRASLSLLDLGPARVMVPILAAVYRAPIGQADFAIWLVGQTGVFKSQLAALAQQHWGPALDAHHLPGSWSSTGNALEVLAFAAADTLLVVDDFAPSGSAIEVQRYHREAARLLRAQGNNAGRSRLRPDGSVRAVKPPRGLILATGEDVPEGHSIRARLVVVELDKGDIAAERLSACQATAAGGRFAAAMAGWIRHLAADLAGRRRRHRQRSAELAAELARGVHARTPRAIAELGAAFEAMLDFSVTVGAIPEPERASRWRAAWRALRDLAFAQASHQEDENPAHRFLELVSGALAAKRVHVGNAVDTDAVPGDAGQWGWTKIAGEYRANGDTIGWTDGRRLYLEPEAAYAAAQSFAARQGTGLAVSAKTLWKRLKEAGLLIGCEPGRNTTKVVIGGQRRRVVTLAVSRLVEGTEAEAGEGTAGAAREDPVDVGGGAAVPGSEVQSRPTVVESPSSVLDDVLAVFEAKGRPRALLSEELMAELVKLGPRPWLPPGVTLTVNRLASALAGFGVRPKQKWIHGSNRRAYDRAEVEMAVRQAPLAGSSVSVGSSSADGEQGHGGDEPWEYEL